MELARKKRKENWTEREVKELQNAYLELRSTLEGRLGPSLSNIDKDNAWKCIHERINAQGSELRSIPEIKKKLSDLKSGVKKRERERRLLSQQTGGGPPPTLSSSDEKMVQAIGEVAISGFCGPDTFDTFDPINDYLPVPSQQPQTTTFLPHTSTCYLPPTFTMKSQSFTTTCKGKSETAKDKDETIKITTILNQHTELLQSILDEQRRTNHILGQLFSSLHGLPGRLQALSSRLHIDGAVRTGLDDVVEQAVQCAETFGRTLKDSTEKLYVQGELLKQAKTPKEVNAKVLDETLKQTRTSFDSTRTGICELQIKVHNLIEDCRGQVNAHNQETKQKKIKIESTKSEIQQLKDKIKLYEKDAENLDHCAQELDNRAQDLNRAAESKKEQGIFGGVVSAVVGIVLAPFTGGVSLIGAAAAAGVTIGVNFNDASNCEKEARSCRDSAYDKRRTANSLKDDVTRMDSDIDTLEREIVRLRDRIGVLEDAIRALEDVKRMLLSSVGASDDVVEAIGNMDTILKETLLARSSFVTSLNARAGSIAERQLENLKGSWARVQTALENNGRYALRN